MSPETPGQPPDHATLAVPNQPAAVEGAESALLAALTRHGYPKAALFALRLCYHEAISNSFRHGHRDLPASTLELVFQDRGPGFDPDAVPDPTTDENLERGSGRGLLLIRAYMAETEYSDRGTRLRLLYRRPAGT
jgi:serine/threonine-protein kinase RsbW